MRKTMTHSGCPICGDYLGGPWLVCSELCWFLYNAEQQLCGEEVESELDAFDKIKSSDAGSFDKINSADAGEARSKRLRSTSESGRLRAA